MNHNKRNIMLTLAALVVLFGLACFVQAEVDSYIRRIVNLCLIYAIIGLSMNVTNGFAGQFSLGQAGFMAIGAYMVGIFTVPVELRADVFYAIPMNPHLVNVYMPLWMALILGGVLAAGIAGLIGTPVLRLRGDYLAIATLGFSEIIRIIITNATSITNGALGIKNIPPLNDVRYIFLATAISYVLITLLLNSSYGRAFKAIREDEIAAEERFLRRHRRRPLRRPAGYGRSQKLLIYLNLQLPADHRAGGHGLRYRQHVRRHYCYGRAGIPARL